MWIQTNNPNRCFSVSSFLSDNSLFPCVFPNRGWTILSSTNSATCHLRNVKQSWSLLRCFSTRSTTGSWRHPPRDARGCPMTMLLDTKPTTPGSTSTYSVNMHYTVYSCSHVQTSVLLSLQMALLLQRASVLRQSTPVRDNSDLWPDAVAFGVHCDEETTAGAGQAGEGQAAAWETHTHSHTLSQVRRTNTQKLWDYVQRSTPQTKAHVHSQYQTQWTVVTCAYLTTFDIVELCLLYFLWLRFLSMLEEEVYSHSSPIWSQDFLAGASGGQIPIHTGNTHPCKLNRNTYTLTESLFTLTLNSRTLFSQCKKQIWMNNMFLHHYCSDCSAVISAPPVARPLYYSTSPVSVDPSTRGSVSPARKTSSALEPNPGINSQTCSYS